MLPVSFQNKKLKDFLNESGIHGLRLMLYYTPFKHARLIWVILMLAIIIWSQFIIISLTSAYIQQPTEVRFSTNQVHVSNSPFPGVAICHPNRLNRSKVLRFAKKIFLKQQLYRPYYLAQTAEEMAQYLLNFKSFFIYPYDNEPLNLTVIERLDEIFTFMFNGTQYPVRTYLKNLAPDCDSLIIRGMIYGVPINITSYFHKRMTSSSVCCMFNYKRKSYSLDTETGDDTEEDKIKFQSNSVLNAMQFVLHSESEDFAVTEFRNKAFQIFIFPRNDYATIQSNRIGEILVDYNTIVEIPITPQFFSSNYQVRQFTPDVRNCYFPDEGQKLLNRSYYSLDECLLLCRKDSMTKYCGCVTPPMADAKLNTTFCNFLNLPCLMQWKAIWYRWDYFQYVQEDGIDKQAGFRNKGSCPKCFPSCNGVEFNIEVNEVALNPNYGEFYKYGFLKGLKVSEHLAIVKLFLKERYVLPTEQNIVGDWVVLLNRFGGIMSFMYGFSIMTFIEIIYYATGKFFASYFKSSKLKLQLNVSRGKLLWEKHSQVSEHQDRPPSYCLYWKELKPPRSLDVKIFKRDINNKLMKQNVI